MFLQSHMRDTRETNNYSSFMGHAKERPSPSEEYFRASACASDPYSSES